jgi:hypothetical protein
MNNQCLISVHSIEHEASQSEGSLHKTVVSESFRNRGNAPDENQTTKNTTTITDQPSLFLKLEKEIVELHGWND